jgi:hypothetical protein
MDTSKETRILIRGINWSGSGTVVDLLREYDNLIQIPGGASQVAPAGYIKFEELWDYHSGMKETLMKGISSINLESIRKYIVVRKKKLVREIYHNFVTAKSLNKKIVALKEFPLIWKLIKHTESYYKKLSLNASQDERIEFAKEWVQSIINTTKGKREVTAAIFDNTIDTGQTKEIWSRVFEPYKLIMVHRNPYDTLAEQVNKKYYLRTDTKKLLLEKYVNDPIGYIRLFVEELAKRQKNLEDIIDFLPTENVLLLKFEDIVLNYDSTKAKIETFLGLKAEDHIYPKKYLKPDWSKNNIGLYDKSNYNFPADLLEPLLSWYNAH